MRLFLSVEPDEAARQRLEALRERLRRDLPELGRTWRWVHSDNVHVTLHFLGEVSEASARKLVAALGDEATQPAFDVEVGALGWFPAKWRPRVLWASVVAGGQQLADLRQEAGQALVRADLLVEPRAFVPHLTLARTRERSRRAAGVPGLPSAPSIRWRVERFTLFRSHLSSGPARYEPLHHVRLLT